jgi:hypothetical protein
MGDALAALVVLLVVCAACVGVWWAWLRWVQRQEAEAARREREARWEVHERSGYFRPSLHVPSSQFGAPFTIVSVRKVTSDREVLDRIDVAEVPARDPDWDARMLEARAQAAARAMLLNERP